MSQAVGADDLGEWEGATAWIEGPKGDKTFCPLPEQKLRPGQRLIVEIGGQRWVFRPRRTWVCEADA